MPRPTLLPEWASSGANIVEPSAGKKAQGWLSGERPPAQIWNWIHRVTYDWVAHLSGTIDRCLEGFGISAAGTNDKTLWRTLRMQALVDAVLMAYQPATMGAVGFNCGLAFAVRRTAGISEWYVQLLVAGNNVIYNSYDSGRTWNAQTSPFAATWSVLFMLTESWLVMAGTAGRIAIGAITSFGPPAWTNKVGPAAVIYIDGAALPGGIGALISSWATAVVHYSTDTGVTWLAGTLPVGLKPSAIAAGAGVFVVVGSDTKQIATSPTGQVWTSRTAAVDTAFGFDDVKYHAGLGLFVAVAGPGWYVKFIHTSPDGVTWTLRGSLTLPSNMSVQLVVTPHGLIMRAVNLAIYYWAYSVDAVNWVQLPMQTGSLTRTFGWGSPPSAGAPFELAILGMYDPIAVGKVAVAGPVR